MTRNKGKRIKKAKKSNETETSNSSELLKVEPEEKETSSSQDSQSDEVCLNSEEKGSSQGSQQDEDNCLNSKDGDLCDISNSIESEELSSKPNYENLSNSLSSSVSNIQNIPDLPDDEASASPFSEPENVAFEDTSQIQMTTKIAFHINTEETNEEIVEPTEIKLETPNNLHDQKFGITEETCDSLVSEEMEDQYIKRDFQSKAKEIGNEGTYNSTLVLPYAPEKLEKFELVNGALSFEVKPGIAMGSFYLGQTLNTVVANLNFNSMLIPTVDFSFDPKEPLSKDFAVQLRNNGLALYFDPSLQILKEVVVHDLSRVRISYRGVICSSVDEQLTSARVHQLLGPTYPGHFNSARDQYIVDYPGISFYFRVPAQSTEHQLVQESPLEFPGTSAPVCHRICVYIHRPHLSVPPSDKGSAESANTPTESTFLSTALAGHLSRAKVVPNVGICLLAHSCEKPSSNVWIKMGLTTAQDCLADLGSPGRIFYKDDNKMDIHRVQTAATSLSTSLPKSSATPSPSSSPASRLSYTNTEHGLAVRPPTDYFYNYFDLGLDVLFDGYTHCAKKVILHTNFPNHFDFNAYRKCHFEFLSAIEYLSENRDILTSWPPSFSAITSDTLVSKIEESWGPPVGRPVVYDHSHGQYQNPFHPTTLRGYSNLILEVLDNGHLAAVTVFQGSL